MFRNYLAAALRNLVRNRLYAAINILGLSIGFAAALFAALFVRYELTYNRWIPGHERTYTVLSTLSAVRGAPATEWMWAYRDTVALMKLDFPEVEAAGRAQGQGAVVVQRGAVKEIEDYGGVASADPDFFSVMPFPAIAGDLATALDKPDGVVLSRAMARKYFGHDTPLGEILEIDQHPLKVTAVVEDFPTNTTFPAGGDGGPKAYISARAPFSALYKWDQTAFTPDLDPIGMVFGGNYVRLKPGVSPDAVQKQMTSFINRRIPTALLGDVQMRLLPIADMHSPPISSGSFAALHARFVAMIWGVSGIGTLIVLAAAINFVNSVTARAARRAVEVGVRKASGAVRRQLIIQFIGEAMVYTTLAMIVGVGLVALLLPAAEGFLDRRFFVDLRGDPGLLGGIAATTLVTGLLAGAYPAFVLASLRPAVVLKGAIRTSGGHLRRFLVTVQFAILIGVVVVTAAIYRQTDFALNENLSFARDPFIVIQNACRQAMITEVEALPGVTGTTCTLPSGIGYTSFAVGSMAPQGVSMFFSPVDTRYFDVLGFTPVAGKFFGRNLVAVSDGVNPDVVINEAAVHALGFVSPEAAIGQQVAWRRKGDTNQAVETLPELPARVIGVVRDFSLNITDPVKPRVFYVDAMADMSLFDGRPYPLTVKLSGRDIPGTLGAMDRLWPRLIDPDRPIRRQFLNEILQITYRDVTRQAHMTTALAGVALFIAALGLFGLSAFTAERRTKEVGVRKAMGAGPADILRLLLWEFVQPVLCANLLAWPAAYAFTQRWLSGFAYHVDLSPWTFVTASAAALAIAVLTVAGNAVLVARSEPATALRYE